MIEKIKCFFGFHGEANLVYLNMFTYGPVMTSKGIIGFNKGYEMLYGCAKCSRMILKHNERTITTYNT